ncbi:xanthine dehydrogenase family protein subunit M [Beijerinckia sp. L45]|uniref:FAD binding domain-containing protein n=1 Tax=Beijerinckia sp. L45 TaxID=1641855 RepID=UPI00131C3ADD|nr:xanthine dehydrogenase family protein subunit M [Beijerinckia sp. L45]
MRPFTYQRASNTIEAVKAAGPGMVGSHVGAPIQYLAGGTTLLDLMKLDVMTPSRLVDINSLTSDPNASRVVASDKGLRIGALVKMAEAANELTIKRDYPVFAQSLSRAASSGLRNMATLGGNMLQRTRCPYFRDTSFAQCNKRTPGSGCAALDGFNRIHAVLGTSEDCIATYPGDFAQALIALDAVLEVQGPTGLRAIPFASLHVQPGNTPNVETVLQPGDLITAINVPADPGTKRSVYVKVRDRESYEFGLATAAVVLDITDAKVKRVRIALGGVATVPWRAVEAEASLTGKGITEETATAAAEVAFKDAKPREHNAYKIPLGKATLVRALLQAAKMEV